MAIPERKRINNQQVQSWKERDDVKFHLPRDWALQRLRRADSGKESHPLLVSACFPQDHIYRLQSGCALEWSGAQICTRIWQSFPLILIFSLGSLWEKLVSAALKKVIWGPPSKVSVRQLTWPTFVYDQPLQNEKAIQTENQQTVSTQVKESRGKQWQSHNLLGFCVRYLFCL